MIPLGKFLESRHWALKQIFYKGLFLKYYCQIHKIQTRLRIDLVIPANNHQSRVQVQPMQVLNFI